MKLQVNFSASVAAQEPGVKYWKYYEVIVSRMQPFNKTKGTNCSQIFQKS
jgi:hypothetical protein